MSRTALVVSLLIVVSTGCAELRERVGLDNRSAPKNEWVWSGKECPQDRRMMLFERETDDERAHTLLCTEWPGFGQGGELTGDMQARNRRLDDRHFDQLTVGVMVLACARFCNEFERIDLGMTAGLAPFLDRDKVRAAVDHLAWSADAKAFFVERVMKAGPMVVAAAERLDPRRHELYVALPTAIRADRMRYYQAHAKTYAALDALAGTRDVDKLVALRASYFASCTSPDCRFDPFVIEVTKQIVLAATAAGDELAATAEGSLFTEQSALKNTYAPMIHRAQYLAMKAEEERWEAYDHAKSAGNDQASLTAKFGATPPIHITAGSAWAADDSAPSLLFGSPEKFNAVSGAVAGVQARGELAEISFADTFSTYELTDFVETDRIDGISSDGHLIYRQNCRSVGSKTERHSTAPIRVPRREAAELHTGEQVTARIDGSRVGRIVVVHNAKAQLVQLRTHRLAPTAKYVVLSPAADVDRHKKG